MKRKLITLIYLLMAPFLIRKGKGQHVYITFDDGPHPKNTLKILDILSTHNVKATFFMVGLEMEKYPEVVSEIIEKGHGIGYHSYDHRSLKKLSLFETLNDFRHAREIQKKQALKFKLYRPPYGDLSFWGMILSVIHGFKIIMWSKDSRDSYDTIEQILETVGPDKLDSGEILLFHDDYDKTTQLLDKILTNYQEKSVTCELFS